MTYSHNKESKERANIIDYEGTTDSSISNILHFPSTLPQGRIENEAADIRIPHCR